MKSKFILSFDIPREEKSFRVKVNRKLKSIGAEKIHHSLWASDDIKALTKIAILIRGVGGKASILEEKFIF